MVNEYTTISILKTDKERFAQACLNRAAEKGRPIPHKEFMTFLLDHYERENKEGYDGRISTDTGKNRRPRGLHN